MQSIQRIESKNTLTRRDTVISEEFFPHQVGFHVRHHLHGHVKVTIGLIFHVHCEICLQPSRTKCESE